MHLGDSPATGVDLERIAQIDVLDLQVRAEGRMAAEVALEVLEGVAGGLAGGDAGAQPNRDGR